MQYFLTNGSLNDIIYEQRDEETRKYILKNECYGDNNMTSVGKLPLDLEVEILADLKAKGYQGDALLDAFKQEQEKVKKAIDSMLADAKSVAEGKSEYFTYDDIFNSDD